MCPGLGIVLVNGPVQKKLVLATQILKAHEPHSTLRTAALRPTGVKKGKKLCVEVPSGMEAGDYDVRLSFGEKIIHGVVLSRAQLSALTVPCSMLRAGPWDLLGP